MISYILFCLQTTLTFVDSISEIFGPLLKGLPLVIFPKTVTQNVELLVNALQTTKITRFFGVTSLIRNMLSFLEMQQKKVIGLNGMGNNVTDNNYISLHRVLLVLYIGHVFNVITT